MAGDLVQAQKRISYPENYAVSIGDYETKGIWLSPDQMLVDFYVLRFRKDENIIDIYLKGDKIENVLFKKRQN